MNVYNICIVIFNLLIKYKRKVWKFVVLYMEEKNIIFYLGFFILKVYIFEVFINLKFKVDFFKVFMYNVEFMSKMYYMIFWVYDFRLVWIGLFFLKDVIDKYGVDAIRLVILGTVFLKVNREWLE